MNRPKLQILERPNGEDFSATLALQLNLAAQKIEDRTLADMLVLVEHSSIYTTGRSVPALEVAAGNIGYGVKWIEVNRGGAATYHGPGQLVAYPIFDLHHHGRDVHVYLRRLEDVILRTLLAFGIVGERREGLTGVWVKHLREWKKIASIGVGLKQWVSYHGLALNVSPDLNYFQCISPCGQDGSVMTSLKEVMGREVEMTLVQSALCDAFREVFEFLGEGEEADSSFVPRKRPRWLRAKAPQLPIFKETQEIVSRLRLNTVCEEAKCPNIGECWSHHTATFMIMGELCTRRCNFCSVKDGAGEELQPLDALEPLRVGKAISELSLEHVVVTSVNRDDLADMGAAHFDATVKAISHFSPQCRIELLIPDMRGRRELVETILQSGRVNVLNHNVETVLRLYRRVRPGAIFQRSLDVLRWAKEISPSVLTKSGLMVGLGETKEEVFEVMDALRSIHCDILTIGQYLRPTDKQLPISRYVTPEEFAEYKAVGLEKGFAYVESGPLVRSSYHAWQHSEGAMHSAQQPHIGAALLDALPASPSTA